MFRERLLRARRLDTLGRRREEGQEPPNPFSCSAGLHRAPAASQVLATGVGPHGPITEQKRHIKYTGKRGRQEKEQRASKITPNPTSLTTLCGLSFQLWVSNFFLSFLMLPFMLTSVPDPLLADSPHMHFLPSVTSRQRQRQRQAEQFRRMPRGNENAWLRGRQDEAP